MRLIDADALLEKVAKIHPWEPYLSEYAQGIRHCMELVTVMIEDAPTIEPKRETGKWVYGENNLLAGRDGWFCDQCGHFELWDYSTDLRSAELNLPNFCPNCGTKMEEAEC